MNIDNRKGFITIVIVSLLALLPVALMVMSRSTISLSTELRESRLEAQSRDVLASGLTWARQNVENLSGYEVNEEISLDVSSLAVKDGKCKIGVLSTKEGAVEIEVGVHFTRGDRDIKRTMRYNIERD
jgi:hypothetical protein